MRLPYSGWGTRRSTRTTTVLTMRAETTTPSRCLTRSRIAGALGCLRRLLGNQGLDPGQLAARPFVAGRILELIGAQLHPQPEHLLAHFPFLDLKVGRTHLFQLVKLQLPVPPVQPSRF